jgi:hypothetical protein
MESKYKPNDVVFIRMNDYSVQKGCVYCVIQKSYVEGVAYSYEVQYAKNKIDTFPQDKVHSTMEEAFI